MKNIQATAFKYDRILESNRSEKIEDFLERGWVIMVVRGNYKHKQGDAISNMHTHEHTNTDLTRKTTSTTTTTTTTTISSLTCSSKVEFLLRPRGYSRNNSGR